MTALAPTRSGPSLLGLLVLAGLLAFAAWTLLGVGALVDVPAPVVSEHAVEKHAADLLSAQEINLRWQQGRYLCLRRYESLASNRVLWRFTYSDTSLEGAVIMTVGGAPVTAYCAPPSYWDGVVVRDGFVLTFAVGAQCAVGAK